MGDRVRFEYRNAFDDDLRDATVVTMWLFPELMRLLRPMILERARPGTRVLTSTWDLGTWPPDKSIPTARRSISGSCQPASAAGGTGIWRSAAVRFTMPWRSNSDFRRSKGWRAPAIVARCSRTRRCAAATFPSRFAITLDGMGLTQHEFSGKVEGDQIVGTVKVTPKDQRDPDVAVACAAS